jgi:ESF2/ABP1 family protein
VELSQSRQEQNDYLRRVELKRVLDKRAERKRKREEELDKSHNPSTRDGAIHRIAPQNQEGSDQKARRITAQNVLNKSRSLGQNGQLESVLSAIF